jgi:BolA protein
MEQEVTVHEAKERIERILVERFRPRRFELRDDSAKHAGHRGATSGGGHFHVTIVAAAFEGKTRLEQHRMVYGALGSLMEHEIHALGLTTLAPSEDGKG